eukprot:CAMPEP_0170306796 /NCGR_PEP_ID=MMETSP0116_2-20130129/53798_1 /TAXON_ID=400756 /ORGANISM="Durinskia baltica, Strain CSIRO CS-38" /LENGTH=287 /DNA_ID=CAMNT_0010558899 /DNA_START=44 /DNA_END=904 /DNA_ORIENTATION=-
MSHFRASCLLSLLPVSLNLRHRQLPIDGPPRLVNFTYLDFGVTAKVLAAELVDCPGVDGPYEVAVKKFLRRRSFLREASNIEAVASLGHDGFVPALAILEGPDREAPGSIIMDIAETSVFHWGKNADMGRQVVPIDPRSAACSLLSALEAIHSDAAHRDVKAGNVLVFCTGGKACDVRLSDFGSMCTVEPIVGRVWCGRGSPRASGTLTAWPPEFWNFSALSTGDAARKSDIWGLGAVLCAILRRSARKCIMKMNVDGDFLSMWHRDDGRLQRVVGSLVSDLRHEFA